MKTLLVKSTTLLLALVLLFGLVACAAVEKTGVWETATYRRDMTLGDGVRTVTVEVAAEDEVITFTVKTDKETVGAALLEEELIAGEEGDFGLYIKTVNGMTADYDVDRSYWAFYIDGDYAMSGVDGTAIDEQATYRLEYTRG